MQVEVSFPVKRGYVSREVGYFHLLAELLIDILFRCRVEEPQRHVSDCSDAGDAA